MDHSQDLIAAFSQIGVTVCSNDIPLIMRRGADQFLKDKGYSTNEEVMSSIYIIMSEARANQIYHSTCGYQVIA